jgi:hypothetical protein
VLVGLGDDFESANAAVMYHARDIVAAGPTASAEQEKEIIALKEGDESTKLWAENWYDGLTYCEFPTYHYLLIANPLKALGTHSGNDSLKTKLSRRSKS